MTRRVLAPTSGAPVDTSVGGTLAVGRSVATFVGVAVAYYVGARLGLGLSLVERNVTPLWPPTGIALAAFVLLGRGYWPAVALAALAVNLPISTGVVPAVATAVGNTAAPLLAAALLQRRGFRRQLDRGRDAVDLVFVAALPAMLVSATIGTTALVLSRGTGEVQATQAFAVWWTGDAMGVLMVAPFLLSLPLWREGVVWPTRRWVELALLLVLVAAASGWVAVEAAPTMFLLLPLLGWAAWRLQLRGAAPAALIASLVATWATTHDQGQLASMDVFSRMLALQGFNASIALTSFVLAALVSERLAATSSLAATATALQGRVERGTADLSAAQARLVHEIHQRSVAQERLTVEEGRTRREHEIAQTLQRSLLPGRLPPVPGVELAARYVPAVGDVQIGGDWYDVVQLPHGRIGLAIGDVAAHGLAAASTMGQLRMALRACALHDPAPAAVLHGVHQILEQLPANEMATLAYLLLDPETGAATYATAGHPPPLVVGAGAGRYLTGGLAPPLGVLSEDAYGQAEVTLLPGDTVLLYTDGLVERRDESIQRGLDRLLTVTQGSDSQDVESLCDDVLAAMLERRPNTDDIAVVVARLALPFEGPLHLRLAAVATHLADLRRTLRRWLRDAGVEDGPANEVLIACGEACANVVQHAYDGSPGALLVDVLREGTDVVVRIGDEGGWRVAGDRGGGWGMALMRSLMDTVEVLPADPGTLVTMRRAVFPADRPSSPADRPS